MHMATSVPVPEDELTEFLERFCVITGLPVAAMALRSGARDEYRIDRVSGEEVAPLLGVTVPPGVGIGGQATFLRRPVVVDEYQDAAGITHDHNQLLAELKVHAVAAIPVVDGDEVVAVVYGGQRSRKPIGEGPIHRGQRLIDDYRALIIGSVDPLMEMTVDQLRGRLAHVHDELTAIARTTSDEATRDRLSALVDMTRMPPDDHTRSRKA